MTIFFKSVDCFQNLIYSGGVVLPWLPNLDKGFTGEGGYSS